MYFFDFYERLERVKEVNHYLHEYFSNTKLVNKCKITLCTQSYFEFFNKSTPEIYQHARNTNTYYLLTQELFFTAVIVGLAKLRANAIAKQMTNRFNFGGFSNIVNLHLSASLK